MSLNFYKTVESRFVFLKKEKKRRHIENGFEKTEEKNMNYDYDLKDFDKPRRDSGPDPYVTVKMSDLTGEFTDLDWNTFRIIVSEGISEEKEAIAAVIDRLIDEEHYRYSYNAVWQAIKKLIRAHLFWVKRINTGYRTFNVLTLTEIGDIAYMKRFNKNIPESEFMNLVREHGSAEHGYMIKDTKHVLEKLGYKHLTTGRSENYIRFTDGSACIPDIIGSKDGFKWYFEVECGNHNQQDFDDKCERLKALSRTLVFVVKNRSDARFKLLPQIQDWIRHNRDRLRMSQICVCLASVTDLRKGKWSYIIDPDNDEPICCFERKKKEGKDNA